MTNTMDVATDAAVDRGEATRHEEALLEQVMRATPLVTAPGWAIPKNWDEVERYAKRICDAGWCPRSHMVDKRPNQASVELAILQGMELRVTPLQAVQGIAIINGVPAIWGDLMLAVVTASGLLQMKDEHFDGEGDQQRAVCRVHRLGRPEPIRREFSVAMARRAGLTDKQGPWKQYPQRMLMMRARSWALRDEFADVLKGLGSADELRDAGALAASIAETEKRAAAGTTAAAISGSLRPAADVHYPTTRERDYRINTADGTKRARDDAPVDAAPPAAVKEGVLPQETKDLLDAAEPGDSGGLVAAPTRTAEEWAEVAQGMINRIDGCKSLDELAVLERSAHLRELQVGVMPEQQFNAAADFLEAKRQEFE